MSLAGVRARIEAACHRAGRRPDAVRLVAVTKGHGPDEIARTLLTSGARDLGENRVQEWREKKDRLPGDLVWHFVGNLQRNKVKYLAGGGVTWVHSLNAARLADTMNEQAARREHTFRALIEVNVFGESQKRGVSPADAAELLDHCRALPHLEVEGLMTMAPFSDDPEDARPGFRHLRTLRDQLGLRELSMGMSRDFEIAIEEGATMVRVGSALFADAGPPVDGRGVTARRRA